MNKENLKKLTEFIKKEPRDNYFGMRQYAINITGKGPIDETTVATDSRWHWQGGCGTVRCIAGAAKYLLGDSISEYANGPRALAEYLEIPYDLATNIACGGSFVWADHVDTTYPPFSLKHITKKMALAVLDPDNMDRLLKKCHRLVWSDNREVWL